MIGVNPGDHDRSRGYLQIDGFRSENRLSGGKDHTNARVTKDAVLVENVENGGGSGNPRRFPRC
jgi:hypothetical protein